MKILDFRTFAKNRIMKYHLSFFLWLLYGVTMLGQSAVRINNPSFSNYIVPGLLAEEQGTLYCTTKVQEGAIWRNYIAKYNIANESFEVLLNFSRTSNTSWINYANFFRYDNFMYFQFGPTLFRLNMTTNETIALITNYSFEALVGPYLIYRGDSSNTSTLTVYNLASQQVANSFTMPNYTDAFHLENNNLYFFGSGTAYQLYRYYIYRFDLSTNQLQTIYTTQHPTGPFPLTSKGYVKKVGNNLIFTTKHTANGGRYVSVNLATNQLNPNFTFDVNSGFIYQAKEPFVLNGIVYITVDNSVYSSDGVEAPTLHPLAGFNGVNFVNSDNNFFTYMNEVYTSLYDPVSSSYTVWKTNGSTKEVLNPIIGSGSYQSSATIYNNTLYFVARNVNDTSNNFTIFKSQGTMATTQPLFSGPNLTLLALPFNYQNQMFFYGETSLNDVNDRGLFKINTTQLNTNELLSKNKVMLYPNPAHDFVHFSSEIQPQSIRLYNVTGQLVQVYNDWSSGSLTLPTQKGIYMLQLTFEEGVITRKICVE